VFARYLDDRVQARLAEIRKRCNDDILVGKSDARTTPMARATRAVEVVERLVARRLARYRLGPRAQ
jgi:hypothetical protein